MSKGNKIGLRTQISRNQSLCLQGYVRRRWSEVRWGMVHARWGRVEKENEMEGGGGRWLRSGRWRWGH
ncbi:DUF4102 domain-containing protein [Sesbania bispinosa]|nr:DUF4102 domain-containing protein [Sesbania bispinosa]